MSVLGIDGCKAGWCYYQIDNDHHHAGIVSRLEDLLDTFLNAQHVFIDMPVGLLEAGSEERLCDLEARKTLSRGRGSSVFRVPVRSAVYADSYEEASQTNFAKTSKKLSKQSWNICAHIREVDQLLRAHPALLQKIEEAHPELCFEGLVGSGLQFRKAVRKGFQERLALLNKLSTSVEHVVAKTWLDHGGYELKRDDIVDACVLALSAQHYALCRSLPEQPPTDGYGHPMKIMYLAKRPD